MIVTLKQGDTFPPVEIVVLTPSGLAMAVPSGTEVRFHMGKNPKAGLKFFGVGEVVDGNAGRISYQWQTGDTDTAGGFLAEFQLTLPDGRILTVPNNDWISVDIVSQLG